VEGQCSYSTPKSFPSISITSAVGVSANGNPIEGEGCFFPTEGIGANDCSTRRRTVIRPQKHCVLPNKWRGSSELRLRDAMGTAIQACGWCLLFTGRQVYLFPPARCMQSSSAGLSWPGREGSPQTPPRRKVKKERGVLRVGCFELPPS